MDEEMNVSLPLFDSEPDIEEAAQAALKSMMEDEETPTSDNDEEETPDADEEKGDVEDEAEDSDDQDDEDHETEADEDDEEGDEDEDDAEAEEAEAVELDDEVEVEVVVNGKTERVSLGALKRLAGQEASLTQKSQAVATQRKALEAQSLYVAKIMQDRYEAAKANVEKYKNVDLFRASRELEPEEFEAIRAAKEAAEAEFSALEREGQEFLKNVTETKQTLLREQAKESLKVITEKIPDWSDKLYDEIRSYAISQGMDADNVNEIVDPGAIIMMHKAMQFDKAQKASAKVVKKIIKAPKKTVRKGSQPADTKASKIKAMQRNVMMNGGDVDDVTELFLASLED